MCKVLRDIGQSSKESAVAIKSDMLQCKHLGHILKQAQKLRKLIHTY